MGIKGLYKLLHTKCPKSILNTTQSDYSGKAVAFDISLFLYQFSSSIRSGSGQFFGTLVSADSQNTSHLLGLFYRIIRFFEKGIKPIFVFDGAAPEAKREEIEQRKEAKEKNEQLYKEALEAEDLELAEKLARRTIRITKEQTSEAIRLSELMGVPVVVAPFEAESQCAYLIKNDLCDAVASEDSDLLPLGCPTLLKDFSNESSTSKNKRQPVKIDLEKVLKELNVTQDQFIDLCVLCGSDYGGKLKGTGATTALKIINEFGCLDSFFDKLISKLESNDNSIDKKNLNKKGKIIAKFLKNNDNIKENYEKLKIAKEQFLNPEVKRKEEIGDIQWKQPNYEELVTFLVEKGFNEERLKKSIEKIKQIKKKGVQQKISNFFVKKKKTK